MRLAVLSSHLAVVLYTYGRGGGEGRSSSCPYPTSGSGGTTLGKVFRFLFPNFFFSVRPDYVLRLTVSKAADMKSSTPPNHQTQSFTFYSAKITYKSLPDFFVTELTCNYENM